MNVPKPQTVSMILKVYVHVRTIYTDCSRVYRMLRHVLYHSAAKSEKETNQLAAES